jgi:hypothetical protein
LLASPLRKLPSPSPDNFIVGVEGNVIWDKDYKKERKCERKRKKGADHGKMKVEMLTSGNLGNDEWVTNRPCKHASFGH